MGPNPVGRITVVGYGGKAEVFGVFDALFTPAAAAVAQVQVQVLRLAGRVGDERGDSAAVDVGEAQQAANCAIFYGTFAVNCFRTPCGGVPGAKGGCGTC